MRPLNAMLPVKECKLIYENSPVSRKLSIFYADHIKRKSCYLY